MKKSDEGDGDDAPDDKEDVADGVGDGVADGGEVAAEGVLNGADRCYSASAAGNAAEGLGGREAEYLSADKGHHYQRDKGTDNSDYEEAEADLGDSVDKRLP